MIRTLLGQVGEYKRASLLTPLFTGLEVVMEVPLLTRELRLGTSARFIYTVA